MAALNWEGLRRSSRRSDYSGDDLPRTGSWVDQKRQGSAMRNAVNRAHVPSALTIQSRSSDFQNLKAYALHAMSLDFKRKSDFMQREIMGIINRLHVRCLSWAGSQSSSEIEIIKIAISLTTKINRRDQ